MTAPVPVTAAVTMIRLRILDSSATDYDPPRYLSGIGARGNVSKAIDGSALSFTANALEAVLDDDPTVLEDAFAVVEVRHLGDWTEVGTPYMLAPGSGTVSGSDEAKARQHVPVGTGALHGLLSECIVLPTACDPDSPTIRQFSRYSVDGNVYRGWMSKGFTEDGTWGAPDEHTISEGDPKYRKPKGWPVLAADAAWINDDDGTGGLTLVRWGTVEVDTRRKLQVGYSCDEAGKVYVDGVNAGFCLIDTSTEEDGFKELNVREFMAEPGDTYRFSSEFTIVDTEGGDGFDACRFYVATLDSSGDIDEILLMSDSTATVRRQSKADVRPGFSLGELFRRELQKNADLGVDAAQILLDNKDFTDSLDSSEDDWQAGEEWTWPAFTTNLAQAFSDTSEDCDLFLASNFTFRAWNDRGGDKTGDVDITPGEVVMDHSWDAEPHGPTGYAVESMDGWDITFVTSAETGTRRRLGSFQSGASASIARARKNARAAVRQTGRIRRYYRTVLAPVEGRVPGIDFFLCDLVHGRGYRNLGLDLELTDWGFEQGAAVLYTVQLGEV